MDTAAAARTARVQHPRVFHDVDSAGLDLVYAYASYDAAVRPIESARDIARDRDVDQAVVIAIADETGSPRWTYLTDGGSRAVRRAPNFFSRLSDRLGGWLVDVRPGETPPPATMSVILDVLHERGHEHTDAPAR